MDTKSRARRCYTIRAARISSSALPPRDLVLHHKYLRRVGVNGPMLKLTFISFIHPAKSAAMRQAAGSQKCPFEDALWFTLCNAASLSWPFFSHTRVQNSCLRHQLRNLLILSGWRKSSRGRHLIIPHHQSQAGERIENTFSSSK